MVRGPGASSPEPATRTRPIFIGICSSASSAHPDSTPSRGESASEVIASDVAISVFDGTQSVSTHAPPTPARSTNVTSAPSCAATSAAS